jgi:hypothetical protein
MEDGTMEEGASIANGLGAWLFAVPVALVCAITLPIMLSLHPLWGLLIYSVTGVVTALSLLVLHIVRTRNETPIAQPQREKPCL